MASRAFEDIMALIADAEESYHTLERRMGEYLASGPIKIEHRDDAVAKTRTYVATKADPIPNSLRIAAKNSVTSAREALDHVAYQLVRKNFGQLPSWRVYFPITDSAEKYPAWRDKCLRKLPQNLLHLFDQIEPYKDGKGHALWQLNELSNATKHRQLLGISMSHSGISISEMMVEAAKKAGIANPVMPDIFLRPEGRGAQLQIGQGLFQEGLRDNMPQRRAKFEILLNMPGIADEKAAHLIIADILNVVTPLVKSFEPYL